MELPQNAPAAFMYYVLFILFLIWASRKRQTLKQSCSDDPLCTQTRGPKVSCSTLVPTMTALFLDENLPDGTCLEPGTKFIKYWKMRNTGNISWTSDTKVLFETHHSLKRMCLYTCCGLPLHVCCVFCSWNLCGATWPWDHGSKKKSQCPICSRVRSVWWAWRLWRPCWRAPIRLTGAWHTAGCSLGLECGVALWWCQVLSRNPPIAANHWWVNFKPQYLNVFK